MLNLSLTRLAICLLLPALLSLHIHPAGAADDPQWRMHCVETCYGTKGPVILSLDRETWRPILSFRMAQPNQINLNLPDGRRYLLSQQIGRAMSGYWVDRLQIFGAQLEMSFGQQIQVLRLDGFELMLKRLYGTAGVDDPRNALKTHLSAQWVAQQSAQEPAPIWVPLKKPQSEFAIRAQTAPE